MTNPGLIQTDKYFTQWGQLRAMEVDNYGDLTDPTSITTIRCLVYQEQGKEDQTIPAVSKVIDHFACVPSSAVVSRGYHLSAVVDVNGSTVLVDSRVTKITEYNHWAYGSRFKKLDLDVDLT